MIGGAAGSAHLSAHGAADGGPGAAPQRSALVIITSLFFMWGLLTSLNDVLIPHLKAIYTLSYVQAMLVQLCFFSAYFLVSMPAGALIRRIGYQKGAVTGLLIAATGCALFYPASRSGYSLFLLAFFVLAAGIATLQVAANPFVTALGPARTASSRLTLTQAFNSLGTAVGPFVGSLLILSTSTPGAGKAAEIATVQGPYLALAAALLTLALVMAAVRLPAIGGGAAGAPAGRSDGGGMLAHRHLLWGTLALFLYVGGEVSIGSFLVSFLGEPGVASLPAAQAARYVSLYWLGAMIGRFIGFVVMRRVSPGKALAFNASLAIALVVTAMLAGGTLAMVAILAIGLCNSIMFPTIFSMSLHGLGKFTGQASGMLCMAIVGGALVPFAQGLLADAYGLRLSFAVPALCYAFVLFFGIKYAGLHKTPVTA
ncbi:sugar MFS transporter [Massilia sp. PWRC2]|uniref:sugar MFS transporter n=1 Tax=Massilia sp. PWRC2 TaxID=2804626 RepID=UPI003CF2B43A